MKQIAVLFSLMLAVLFGIQAQQFTYSESWGNAGFNLVAAGSSAIEVVYSVPFFALDDQTVNGEVLKNIMLPGNFLFNDPGAPNLPGHGQYIAIPQGSAPSLRIISQQTEVIHHVEIIPAPVIPTDIDDNPLQYIRNMNIYGKDALYPVSPVTLSDVVHIRGADAVILGITPFQYNPVTKDLIVYRDLRIAIDCEGGTGVYGDDRLRSQYWDGLLSDVLLNYSTLPQIDYGARMTQYLQDNSRNDECEYIIISPTGDDFIRWADSIARFRNEQGILTHVFTIDEIGGNTADAIENFINNAYNTWNMPPVACLLMGDYGSDGSTNITSEVRNDHPNGYNPYITDNGFSDVTGDLLPDVIFARMTANNDAQLNTFITKFLSYERTPETDTAFYNHPITALGWQTERWFQLCSEIVGGYFKHVKGRQPNRINAIYEGTPGSVWSTAPNTNTVVNYFGPNGLGYIPATPAELGGWTGGNASQITSAINAGAFFIQHRDHGLVTGWGEPSYSNSNISQLSSNKLIHVFSINCQTGKFNTSGECFGEKFHRHTSSGNNAGALSFTGPTEASYSYVNDIFVWGMIDYLWPDFMPAKPSAVALRGILPAFGVAAGKYFLQASNWQPPGYNDVKPITYRLFHHFGDAFSCLYDTVPATLDVTHDSVIAYGSTTFTITATDSSFIALSNDGELLATAWGAGTTPVVMTIPVLPEGTIIKVVVTMRNCFRYEDLVPVTDDILIADFVASETQFCDSTVIGFTDLSGGSPEAWEWTFEGGTPSTSTEQNPSNIQYNTVGAFSVTLTVTKGVDNSTETKTDYIQVFHTPAVYFEEAPLCENTPVEFTDLTDPNGGTITGWDWNFGDPASGTNNTSALQNPTHSYKDAGTFTVTLLATNNGGCTVAYSKDIVIGSAPDQASPPEGDTTLCQASAGTIFTTEGAPQATSYQWTLDPAEAGTLEGAGTEVTLNLSETFFGPATLGVSGVNDCGTGLISILLSLNVMEVLPAPIDPPAGPDVVDLKDVTTSDYEIAPVTGAIGYDWMLDPDNAGSIAPANAEGTVATVTWNPDFRGTASITVAGQSDECTGLYSAANVVTVKNTLGINEFNAYNISVYPNPNAGKFNLVLNTSEQSVVSIKIFNILGTQVYTEGNVAVFHNLTKTVDLSSLPKGIYHLKVEGTRGISIIRIVIDR